MKSQTKNSKPITKGEKITNKRSQGQRPGQRQVQGKGPRVATRAAPVAIGNKTFQSKPRYRSMGEGLCVSHSEYVQDILSTTDAFKILATLPLNPGISTAFPWLNKISSRYESYRFIKLNFRFVTERPTTESGYVALAVDYDPSDPPPTSKAVAFQYESTAKCAPWENVTFRSNPKNLAKRRTYFCRQSAKTDVALFDTGNLFICVGGNSGSDYVLGELWCDYEVCFETPQIDSTDSQIDSVLIQGTTNETAALPFGDNPSEAYSISPLLAYDNTNGRLVFLRAYQGLAAFSFAGTTISAVLTTGSTATITDFSSVVNGAGTATSGNCRIVALAGQQIDFVLTAVTITASTLRLGEYSLSH